MNKYIITGASGWLGRNFLSELIEDRNDSFAINISEEDSIKCLCMKEEIIDGVTSMPSQVEWVTGDLKSGEGLDSLFSEADGAILVHLAGLIHPKLFTRDFNAVNFEGSKNLVNAAINAKVSKIVVMSSNSPVGCNPSNDHLFTEESPYAPYMGYGKSKHNLELYLLGMMEKLDVPPIVIIRAPWFYGPFQPPRQKLFFQMVETGKFPILGDGNQKRSMVYTENLCQGLLLAIKNDAANNNIFWIADENPYSMNDIVETIKTLLSEEFGRECSPDNLYLPSLLGDIAYAADYTLQFFGLYQQKIHVLSEMNKTIACSIDKSKYILGYSPKIALYDGMRKSIKEVL
jgi:nucleoside-diphosphate-sugar epimerase